MKMVTKLNRLIESCVSPSGCSSYSDEEYVEEEETYDVEEYNSDDEHPRKRFLTDDDIYADNGYDADFDMPDAYQDRIRDRDYYGQYESLKRNGRRTGRRVNESRVKRVSHRVRRTR